MVDHLTAEIKQVNLVTLSPILATIFKEEIIKQGPDIGTLGLSQLGHSTYS